MKEMWKKFDEVELTHSSIHHLMAMHELLKQHGYVRGVDISKYLNISRSSVSITLRKLIGRGYVTEDENKFYLFTEHGEDLINSVLSKRNIIRLFFENALQLDPKIAEAEACKIEHLLEESTGQKLMSFMGFYLSDQEAVKDFRDQFSRFRYECNETENCDICEVNCYYQRQAVESKKK
jgi:DtxR family Mn-dependent transcriptional regulator